MNNITNSMFQSIKAALQKAPSQSLQKNILKLEVGNNYVVRLLPNVKDPEKTFFHYYTVGWTSYSTGQYVSALSPATFGERDPITEARYRILKSNTETPEMKKKADTIKRIEKWLVNAYVVKDPKNPDNNGKVMIIRYGKQLQKIIADAIEGEDSEQFGARIFDMSEYGCNLNIKVEKQGDYPTYVTSKFSPPKSIDGLNDAKIEEIYKNTYDLSSVIPSKSQEELVNLLEEHFYCNTTASKVSNESAVQAVEDPYTNKKPVASVETTSDSDDIDDDKVKELLEGLDNL
jgi:hypothetical protein